MKKLIPAHIRVPVIFFAVFAAMEFFIDSGDRPAFLKYPMLSLFLFVFLFLLIAIEIVGAAADNITYQILTDEQKQKLADKPYVPITQRDWYKNLIKKLTDTEPVEDEASLLLHHDYDGIKELDNNLPPWWTYLFYATIVFSAIYLIRFEIMGADNQEDELRKEIAQAQIDIAEYKKTAPDLMDEKTVTLLTDAEALAAGKTIFQNNCAACHRADAGGQIGPNLTDEQWILGGGIKEIFHTINNGGRDGKGMVAWRGTIKPTEIQQVASYILSLKGSNPKEPKAPEGEVWAEAATAATAANPEK